MNRKRTVIIAALLILLSAGAYALRKFISRQAASGAGDFDSYGRPSGDAAPLRQAKLFQVRKAPFTDVVDGLIGTVKGDTIELAFGGQEEKLNSVHVSVGQKVDKGQILLELDHVRAESRKNQAEIALERAQRLQAVGGATLHDVKEAQAVLNVAQKDYEDTFIYSPKTGTISAIHKHVGETVGRSEVVVSLVSMEDKFYVETGVVEGQIDQVRSGQKAEIVIDSFAAHQIAGSVQGVSHEVSMTGRTGTVHISLPDYVQQKVRPGLSARCRIIVYSKNALVIPRKAYDDKKKGVMIVSEGNKTALKPVQLGYLTREFYEVASGLEGGEMIIADISSNPVEEGAEISAAGEPARYQGGSAE